MAVLAMDTRQHASRYLLIQRIGCLPVEALYESGRADLRPMFGRLRFGQS